MYDKQKGKNDLIMSFEEIQAKNEAIKKRLSKVKESESLGSRQNSKES